MELAMMTYESGNQGKLFYSNINIEKKIPPDHILRQIEGRIDF